MYTNFAFLHNLWPEFEELGTLAETYLYADPNNCMFKSGLLCEKMVIKIFEMEKLYLNPKDNQYDRIKKLSAIDIIPRNIEKYLTVIRKDRNDAAHKGFSSLEHAKISLRYTYQCCVWFMEVYGDFNYEAAPYVEPENISQDTNYNEIIEAHEQKLLALENQLKEIQKVTKLLNIPTVALPQISESELHDLETVTKFFNVHSTDSIDVLDLSVRCIKALKKEKVLTVGQLFSLTEIQMRDIRNLGNKSVDELLSVQKRIRIVDSDSPKPINANTTPGEMQSESQNVILIKYFTKRDILVNDLNLPLPLKKNLIKNGYEKFTDLLNVDEDTLRGTKGVGTTKIQKILAEIDALATPVLKKIQKGILTFENVDEPDDADIDTMLFNLFLQSASSQLTLGDLVSKISGTMELGTLSASIGRLVLAEKIVLNSNGTYELKLPSILDVAEKITNKKYRSILLGKLSGKTLEEIGKELNVTRERVRQLESKCLDTADQILHTEYNLPKYAEDRYAEIASTYTIDQDIWINYVGISKETYYYFKLRRYSSSKTAEEAISDESINRSIRESIQNYYDRDYVYIDGVRVRKTKSDLESYLIMKKCHNDTSLYEFFNMYRELVKEIGLDDDSRLILNESEERSRENKISKSDITLWKYKKKFRYYDTSVTSHSFL